MVVVVEHLSADFLADLENKYFWWEHVGTSPRTPARILAQAMNFSSFDDVLHLEKLVGAQRLADVMLVAQPGWLSERSWEFWRGRLALQTGRELPDVPPRRVFDAV